MHQQHLNPSREESHQPRALSRAKAQKARNREHHRNRLRALLVRGQSLDKDLQGRDLSKGRGHQAKGLNQPRVPLAKDPLGRGPGKVKDHQARGPKQDRVPLVKGPNQAKDPLGRDLGKVRDNQGRAPNRVALPSKKVVPHNKGLGSLVPDSKDHQALGLFLGSHLRVEGLLVNRGLGSLEVASVPCVRPPS